MYTSRKTSSNPYLPLSTKDFLATRGNEIRNITYNTFVLVLMEIQQRISLLLCNNFYSVQLVLVSKWMQSILSLFQWVLTEASFTPAICLV